MRQARALRARKAGAFRQDRLPQAPAGGRAQGTARVRHPAPAGNPGRDGRRGRFHRPDGDGRSEGAGPGRLYPLRQRLQGFHRSQGLRGFRRLGQRGGERVSGPLPQPPAIVLVRPQLGENIGKAGRAMLNLGLVDMRLVAPRDGWPNPDAGPAASGADVVLANARVFDTVQEAIADCHYVYATTVRKRGLTKPVVTPEMAAGEMRARPERSALLFGPERSGLETDDVALAQAILTVPVNPDFGSLNLAQAVILVAYEWSKQAGQPEMVIDNYEGPASQASIDGLVGQVDDALEAAGYYHVPARVASSKRTLRNLLTRPGWSEKEVRALRGIVHALVEGRRGVRPRG